MRPVLQNQPQIGNLGQFLLDALRNMLTAITTGWNQQHNGDGAHTDVTAESLAVTPGVSVLSTVRLNYADWRDDGVSGNHNNITVPNLPNVSWLRLSPAQSLGVDLEITGIDATGREPGDLLLLTHISQNGLQDTLLHLEDTNSLAANRFMRISEATPFTLTEGRGVWLIRDFYYTSPSTPPEHRWRILESA